MANDVSNEEFDVKLHAILTVEIPAEVVEGINKCSPNFFPARGVARRALPHEDIVTASYVPCSECGEDPRIHCTQCPPNKGAVLAQTRVSLPLGMPESDEGDGEGGDLMSPRYVRAKDFTVAYRGLRDALENNADHDSLRDAAVLLIDVIDRGEPLSEAEGEAGSDDDPLMRVVSVPWDESAGQVHVDDADAHDGETEFTISTNRPDSEYWIFSRGGIEKAFSGARARM